MKVLTKKNLSDQDREPVEIKWEPSEGKMYAILYRRMVEVFNVEDETGGEFPCSHSIFDTIASSFDFIGPQQLCISDEKGNFTILKNIHLQESLTMNIINTKFDRIRQVRTCYSDSLKFQFLSALSTDCKMAIWSCDRILAFEDDLTELKADRVVKSKHRLTCLAV